MRNLAPGGTGVIFVLMAAALCRAEVTRAPGELMLWLCRGKLGLQSLPFALQGPNFSKRTIHHSLKSSDFNPTRLYHISVLSLQLLQSVGELSVFPPDCLKSLCQRSYRCGLRSVGQLDHCCMNSSQGMLDFDVQRVFCC